MALLRGLRAATARLPRRPPPQSTRPRSRRALTSTKKRSKTSHKFIPSGYDAAWYEARASGALNDEPPKNPMLDAVLGAAIALFFGGGIYALWLRASGRLSVPADPTDVRNAGWDGEQFTKVKNERYKGWRRNFTDEELETMGDNPTAVLPPSKAQQAAVLAARRQAYTPIAEIVAAAPVVVFSAPDCPYCDEAKIALRGAGVAFTEVAASDWQRAQLTKRTGSRTVPQVFVGGEFVGGCHDGGLGGTVPLLRMGLLQAMAERAAGERVKQKQAVHAAASAALAGLGRQLAAYMED